MSFGDDIKKLCDKSKARIGDVVSKTAFDMQSSMVMLSPVDTGRLRANWQCGMDAINPDHGQPPGSDARARTAQALSNWKPGQTIFLTNSLPYARVVEYGLYGKPPGSANGPKTRGGYSIRAPQGMVRLTVQRFDVFFREAAARA